MLASLSADAARKSGAAVGVDRADLRGVRPVRGTVDLVGVLAAAVVGPGDVDGCVAGGGGRHVRGGGREGGGGGRGAGGRVAGGVRRDDAVEVVGPLVGV